MTDTARTMRWRRVVSSEWTVAALGVALGVALAALHAHWFFRSAHQAEVLSGFGGAMTVLGVFVTAQPYIRKGLIETAREQIGLHPASSSLA